MRLISMFDYNRVRSSGRIPGSPACASPGVSSKFFRIFNGYIFNH